MHMHTLNGGQPSVNIVYSIQIGTLVLVNGILATLFSYVQAQRKKYEGYDTLQPVRHVLQS